MTAPRTADIETLACAIAGRYAGRWARGVARIVDVDAEDGAAPTTAWFVDGFAGADLQRAAIRGKPVEPGAITAVRSMAGTGDGAAPRMVLVEEDPGLVKRLQGEMERIGAGDRVHRTDDAGPMEPGHIALIEAPFTAVAARLAEQIGGAPALVRLAPASARGLPWTALQPFAALPAADLLIRFPEEDFRKQARATGPLADFPPHLRRLVEACAALLGDARNTWVSALREAERRAGTDEAVAAMVHRYRDLLAGGEARPVRVQRVESGAEFIHLLLSSPQPMHVLELNGAIADGGGTLQPTIAVPEPEPEPEPELPAALDLFPAPPPPPPDPRPRALDPEAIADDLHARHFGRLVPYRELLSTLADSGLTPEQVRLALALLKRAGRAAFRSLDAADADIDFLAEPVAPAPRKPRRRKPMPDELGLFDVPDGE